MEISILMTLTLSSLLSTAPNLCDDAHLNAAGEPITDSTGRTLSRHCEWTGPDAPMLEANVCCSIATDDSVSCQLANLRGYCSSGARMWCERGEVDSATGVVTCMEAFPSACAAGFCVEAPGQGPLENGGPRLCAVVVPAAARRSRRTKTLTTAKDSSSRVVGGCPTPMALSSASSSRHDQRLPWS